MAAEVSPIPLILRGAKPATEATCQAHMKVRKTLPFADRTSFDNASRGLIASIEPMTIRHARQDRVVYDLSAMSFLEGDAPDTVNPSLWRQAQLNGLHHGLFEVVPGIWQVRSFDIANMTFIRGDTGWIIIDPLSSAESARAALDLVNLHLGERPVVAVIISHSHVDHYGGVLGIMSIAQGASGEIKVIAPEGFVTESLSENVLAGNVMQRRATYMYGNLLAPGVQAFVTAGLGAALSMGSIGFIQPNDVIRTTGETRCIDGVEIEFQMTPGTEAPAEMVFWFPQHRALCMSEITSHHQHNLYTPRGAQVRDALAWSQQIQESIDRYGGQLDVHFASHHWPTWGRVEAVDYMERQRDLYKFIHDQSLRLANHGYNMDEIAEQLRLPSELARDFSSRGYYGTLNHAAKAVYVKYLGHFDGNPAHLEPHPPVASARRYLDFMGGADAVVTKAGRSFEDGDYRWVAQVLNHVVMAEPEHVAARSMLADAYEQLGYQAESAPWRNFYLCGAMELREGMPASSLNRPASGVADSMPLEDVFKMVAIRVNSGKADGIRLSLALAFSDLSETWLLHLGRGVFHAHAGRGFPEGVPVLRTDSRTLKRVLLGLEALTGMAGVETAMATLAQLLDLLDDFNRRFPLVTPRT
jgi:alkyl sulfatase BDS1-like metallo-beta-lactamase superfamily hydrolase